MAPAAQPARGGAPGAALRRHVLPRLRDRRHLRLLDRLPVCVLRRAVLGELTGAVLARGVALSVRVGVLLVGARAEAPGRENGDGNKSR